MRTGGYYDEPPGLRIRVEYPRTRSFASRKQHQRLCNSKQNDYENFI